MTVLVLGLGVWGFGFKDSAALDWRWGTSPETSES